MYPQCDCYQDPYCLLELYWLEDQINHWNHLEFMAWREEFMRIMPRRR